MQLLQSLEEDYPAVGGQQQQQQQQQQVQQDLHQQHQVHQDLQQQQLQGQQQQQQHQHQQNEQEVQRLLEPHHEHIVGPDGAVANVISIPEDFNVDLLNFEEEVTAVPLDPPPPKRPSVLERTAIPREPPVVERRAGQEQPPPPPPPPPAASQTPPQDVPMNLSKSASQKPASYQTLDPSAISNVDQTLRDQHAGDSNTINMQGPQDLGNYKFISL